MIITAPYSLLPAEKANVTIFLAGTIDNGEGVEWQHEVIAVLNYDNVALLNPRRANWNTSVPQEASCPEFRQQVEWELLGMKMADTIAMYFAPGSKSPITLLELGLFAHTGKLVVACPDGFWRKGNVEIVCEQYNIPLLSSIRTLNHYLFEKHKAEILVPSKATL